MTTKRQRRHLNTVRCIAQDWTDEQILAYWNNPPRTKKGLVSDQALKITDAIIEAAKLRNIQLPCT